MKKKIFQFLTLGALVSTLFVTNISKQIKGTVADNDPVDTVSEIQALIDGGEQEINLECDIVVDDETGPIVINEWHSVTINGNGHLITAAEPGTTEYGDVNPNATYSNLIDVQGDLTIDNTILRGGASGAINVSPDSNFSLLNSTVERSGSPDMRSAGVLCEYGSDNKILFKNSKISRNISNAGGGFYICSKYFIAEDCSFNENRSCAGNGGGGAGEFGGTTAIFNNCTIANNSSTEIGGAINCNGYTVTFINCNIIGNSTTYFWFFGGGIGINSSYINLFNSNITNNFYINDSETIASDVGFYSGSLQDNINVYGSSYKGILAADVFDFDNRYYNHVDGNNLADLNEGFYSYTNNSSLIYSFDDAIGESYFKPSILMHRPILVLNEKGTYESYLYDASSLLNGGCDTYFSYPEDISLWSNETIRLSYKKDGVMQDVRSHNGETECYFAKPTEQDKVTTYQDGRVRSDGVIGASGVNEGEYCTLTVLPDIKIDVMGGTCFGDTYAKGTTVSVSAIEKDSDNYPFQYWYDLTNDKKYYDIDHFKNYVLNENLTIQPVSRGMYSTVNVTVEGDSAYFGGYMEGITDAAENGSIISPDIYPEEGYEFSHFQLENSDSGMIVENVVNSSFEMPNYNAAVYGFFWQGSNPVGKELTYTGEEQELAVAGYSGYAPILFGVDDGVFYYSLTGETDDYSTEVPKATNAGQYTVYWKYYHDSESSWFMSGYDRSGTVKATISGIDYPEADIEAINFEDTTVYYDGEKHFLTAANMPSGMSATYSYNHSIFNGAKEIGEYTITANFISGPTYNQIPSKTATLRIVEMPTVSSIAVTTNAHRSFTKGDNFVKETVIATYSDESTLDVTNEATFSGFDTNTVGEQTITVTFEGKTTTYNINVVAPTPVPTPTPEGGETGGSEKITNLLWLIIVLSVLDFVGASGIVYLLKVVKDEKKENEPEKEKENKKPTKLNSVALFGLLFIEWQFITVVILAVILLGLIAANIVLILKYRKAKKDNE